VLVPDGAIGGVSSAQERCASARHLGLRPSIGNRSGSAVQRAVIAAMSMAARLDWTAVLAQDDK